MFIAMLEIEEEDRLDFKDLLAMVSDILFPQKVGINMLNSNSSQRNLEHSRGNRTPGRAPVQPARNRNDPRQEDNKYRNDVSPFRGRFGKQTPTSAGTDRMRKTPDRGNQSRSPMRRNLQINTRGERETFGGRCMATPKELDFQGMHQNVSPLGRR